MAKSNTVLIKLESTAGTGHFYVTNKNTTQHARQARVQEVRPGRAQARRLQRDEAEVDRASDRFAFEEFGNCQTPFHVDARMSGALRFACTARCRRIGRGRKRRPDGTCRRPSTRRFRRLLRRRDSLGRSVEQPTGPLGAASGAGLSRPKGSRHCRALRHHLAMAESEREARPRPVLGGVEAIRGGDPDQHPTVAQATVAPVDASPYWRA